MDMVEHIADLRRQSAQVRAAGRSVGFVPTMGNLHAGHCALIERAAAECQFVVVSIFVNPTQFGPGEDFASYPRTLEADLAACGRSGAHLVFHPPVAEMYPAGAPRTSVRVAELSGPLCGQSRPGHFDGVCLVVAKLLNLVAPDRAYFGEKDYQQLTIVRRMAADLDFPVTIVPCPTIREADGLAMSSRNGYLTPEQRRQAPALHAAMQQAADRIAREHPPAGAVRQRIREHLARFAPDGEVEYVEIFDPESLASVETTDRPVRIALAVRLGRARLIDNMAVESTPGNG